MKEKDEKGSKIVPLFPAKDGESSGPRRSSEGSRKTESADPEILDQIQGLLGDAQHDPPESHKPLAPEAGHRNAVLCPQCDKYTWRMNQHCVHCGADLWAHAEERVWRRRRRRHNIARGCFIGSWVVAIGCIYSYNHFFNVLSPLARDRLMTIGIVIIAVHFFIFWISEDHRKR